MGHAVKISVLDKVGIRCDCINSIVKSEVLKQTTGTPKWVPELSVANSVAETASAKNLRVQDP